MYEFRAPNKRRPVLVLSRDSASAVLQTVVVAQITGTIRGAPSEVQLGVEEGLKKDSVVVLDHVNTVAQGNLRQFVGTVPEEKMRAVCRAINIALGCV